MNLEPVRCAHSNLRLAALICVTLLCASVLPAEEPPIEWRETTRDVYFNGQLTPAAIVLRASDPTRLALLRDTADSTPMVLSGDELTLGRVQLDGLVMGETGWEATSSAAIEPLVRGRARRVDDASILIRMPRASALIAPHNGTAGEITRDEIFRSVQTWGRLYHRFEPDPDVVAVLRGYPDDVELTLALGTWCGDSKRAVPRLLKTVEAAANPKIKLAMISIHGGFDEPAEFIFDERLTNVPTLIVSRNGQEIGRVVETPATDSFGTDLVTLLAGRFLNHEGRWEREERIASGRYALLDGKGIEHGSEDWELFTLENGGRLLHARIERDETLTEIWHRRDETGRSGFVEITRNNGEWLSRSRINLNEENVLRVNTRGNGTGIARQTLRAEPDALLLTPSTADLGVSWLAPGEATERPALLLGGAGEAIDARRARTAWTLGESEPVETPAGAFDARRVEGSVGERKAEGWLHAELGVPVRAGAPGGREWVLVELTR